MINMNAFLVILLFIPVILAARPDAPDGYAPAVVDCPRPRPSIRSASSRPLSPDETAWLDRRSNKTLSAMQSLLSNANVGINTTAFLDALVRDGIGPPVVAIAVSGGGYRSLMTGAGALEAFDDRSSRPSRLAGLLQSTTYLAGLSGGSWLVGSLYAQNFSTVESIVSSKLWQFDQSILQGPSDLNTVQYYRQLYDDVKAKEDAGFNTSITDYWGRALSYQFINATNGGPAYTYSSIANDTYFTRGEAPLPLIVAVQRQPGQLLVPTNSTILEFTPWEMGSQDPGIAAFAPLHYVGSNFPSVSRCVAGVDNLGFVMGTSSSLFNQAFLRSMTAQNTSVPDFLLRALNDSLAAAGRDNQDVANWPNPFYHYNVSSATSNTSVLALVDGGEDLQNIPFHPLIRPERGVDVIFAIDSSADTPSNWPNGTAMRATYQRSNSTFPRVPDANTFVNLGLNRRPTFFGCQNGTTNSSVPLVVYIPNAPYSSSSNVSTFDLRYSDDQRDAIIRNGYHVATLGNGTQGDAEEWPTCVACAVMARSLARSATNVPRACERCFAAYCWNGTTNSTPPSTHELRGNVESAWSPKREGGATLAMLAACISLLMMV